MTEALGRRHVRAAAEVDELLGVAVRAHDAGIGAFAGVDALDDLDLVGLVGEQLEAVVDAVLLADEGLVLADDLAHARLDALEVLVGEVRAAGQLEVVVEAVLHRRADGELGAGPELEDGLGHDVRRRVPQHVAALFGVVGDDADCGAVGQRRREVDFVAVDRRGDRRLGQAPSDRRGQFGAASCRREALSRSRRAATR